MNFDSKILRLILIPFTVIYYVIIFVRNFLYDVGIIKEYRLRVPVISVGNISVGGTGKTPFIIYLARFYLNAGKSIGIISRGYRKTSNEMVLVSDGKQIYISPEEAGDEVHMIASDILKDFSRFSIVSSANRLEASNFLLQNFKCDLILLDDAYQHRKIHRDLDIVMIDTSRLFNFSDKIMLPTGNLREPFGSLKRSSLIILNHKFTKQDISDFNVRKFHKPILNINYLSKNIYNKNNESLTGKGIKAVLFCGIAEPNSFISAVKNEGIKIDKVFRFSDHYIYSQKDIDKIKCYSQNDIIFLTTEKDFVKLLKFRDFIDNYSVYYLKIEVNILKDIEILEKELNSIIN